MASQTVLCDKGATDTNWPTQIPGECRVTHVCDSVGAATPRHVCVGTYVRGSSEPVPQGSNTIVPELVQFLNNKENKDGLR